MGITKSDYIRQHAELSAKQIVDQAKADGLSIAQAMVYTVRGRAIPTRGRGRPRTRFAPEDRLDMTPRGERMLEAHERKQVTAALRAELRKCRERVDMIETVFAVTGEQR